MDSEEYFISWNEHPRSVVGVVGRFLEEEVFVDCTIAAEGEHLKAHRLILSACSPYFELLFSQQTENDEVLVLEDISFEDLKSLIVFMYHGQVTVPKERVRDFVRAAVFLQIEGFTSGLVQSLQRGATEISVMCEKEGLTSHLSHKLMRRSVVGGKTSELQCENPKTSCIDRKQSGNKRSLMRLQVDLHENMSPQPHTVLTNDSKRDMADKEPSVESKGEVEVEDTSIWKSEDENTSAENDLFTSATAGDENRKKLTLVPGTVSDSYGGTSSSHVVEVSGSPLPSFSLVTGSTPSSANTARSSPFVPSIPTELRSGPVEECSSLSVQTELAEQSFCVKSEPVVKAEVLPAVFSIHSECTVKPFHQVLVEDMRFWEGDEEMIGTGTAVIYNQETSNEDPDIVHTEEFGMVGTVEKTLETETVVGENEAEEEEDFTPLSERVSRMFEKKSQKSSRCPDVFGTINDVQVQVEKQQRKKQCEVCKATFAYKSELTTHMRIHTVEHPFECDVCGESFREKVLLSTHKVTHPGEPPFQCVCRKSFSLRKSLIRHMRTHTGERPFQCDTCKMSFRYRNSLTAHKQKHTGERPFQCDICGKSFGHVTNLTAHKRLHMSERPFQCEMCGRSFSLKQNLTVHIRMHTDERPFECDVCGKFFRRQGHLSAHKVTHTGERPFQCNFCKMSFRHRSHLTAHRRIHTGERPFQCEMCDMSFSQSNSLTTHKRTHTGERPFQCNFCKMSFSHSSHLTVHKRTHTGERPFQCEMCDKSFSQSNSLIAHKRTHTCERPFQCDICQKLFSRKSNLIIHLRTHPGERR